jgi:hypothetical protein
LRSVLYGGKRIAVSPLASKQPEHQQHAAVEANQVERRGTFRKPG